MRVNDSEEYKLRRELFENMDVMVRPVKSHSDAVNVSFSLTVKSLSDLVSDRCWYWGKYRDTAFYPLYSLLSLDKTYNNGFRTANDRIFYKVLRRHRKTRGNQKKN